MSRDPADVGRAAPLVAADVGRAAPLVAPDVECAAPLVTADVGRAAPLVTADVDRAATLVTADVGRAAPLVTADVECAAPFSGTFSAGRGIFRQMPYSISGFERVSRRCSCNPTTRDAFPSRVVAASSNVLFKRCPPPLRVAASTLNECCLISRFCVFPGNTCCNDA